MAHTERRTSVFWLANEDAKVGGEMGGKIGRYCQKKYTGRGYGHIVGKHTNFVIGRFALCAFATYLSGFLDWVFIVAGKIIELRRY